MTTLKFNRYETLSRIENMFLSNLIDAVREFDVASVSKLKNMLNGAQDGHLYSFEDTLGTFRAEVSFHLEGRNVEAARLASDIAMFEEELRNRLA
jgi:hypothetical protein